MALGTRPSATRASVRPPVLALCKNTKPDSTSTLCCAIVRSRFAEIYCQDTTADSGSSWQAAPAGDPATIVSGTCDDGYYVADGAPYRGCDIDGNWQTIQNPCQRTPIDSNARAVSARLG